MAFEIFPWCAMRRHSGERDIEATLRDIKECGFTASCFIEAKDAPLCKKVGLDPIIYPFYNAPMTSGTKGGIDTYFTSSDGKVSIAAMLKDKSTSHEEIERATMEALAEMPEEPFTLYVVDEPGAASFGRIRVMVDVAKKCRTDIDFHICLFPNYAMCGKPEMSQLETATYEEYLEQYCKLLGNDVPMSVDNYEILIGMDNQKRNNEKLYYHNLIQCREACDRYGVEFNYILNSNQLRTFVTIPTMSNLMLQAFSVIAAGSRSIAWFTYFGRAHYCYAPVDDNGDEDIRTPVWYLLKEVNRRALSIGNELERMKYTGMYFTDTSVSSRAKSVADCPAIKAFSSDLPCMVGTFDDGGDTVAIIVNTSLEHSTRFEIDLGGELLWWSTEYNKYIKPLTKVGVDLPGAATKTTPAWLAPGDAVVVRVKK